NAAGTDVSLSVAAGDADADTLTYTATGLPPGLSIDPGSGVIDGTLATSAATGSPYSVSVRASDGAASATGTFTWTVTRVGLTTPGDHGNISGDAVALQVEASSVSGPLTYSASSLPPGLSINSSTGLISGTLTTSADAGSPYTVTVTAAAGGTSASQNF